MDETKVLVTGGAGFIGSHVVDHLIETGYDVAVVDDLSNGQQRHLNQKARFYNVDIRSDKLTSVFEKERPDVITHYAAQTSVQNSVRNPIHDANLNIIGSLNVLENARTHGVRKVIFASTGGALYGEPKYLPCDEFHPVHPISPYGNSKYSVEGYLCFYNQMYGLAYTALRYSNVYGPRQDSFGEAGVVAIFTRTMVQGMRPTINGTGEQSRDFLYVSDAAEACIQAMKTNTSGVFNIATGTSTSVNHIFGILKNALNYKQSPIYGPANAGEVFKIYLECTRARTELNWVPQISLEQGKDRTIDYFLHNTIE